MPDDYLCQEMANELEELLNKIRDFAADTKPSGHFVFEAGVFALSLRRLLDSSSCREIMEEKLGKSAIQEAEEYLRFFEELRDCDDRCFHFPMKYYSKVCKPIFERLSNGILDPNDETIAEMFYNMSPHEFADYLHDTCINEVCPNIDPRFGRL